MMARKAEKIDSFMKSCYDSEKDMIYYSSPLVFLHEFRHREYMRSSDGTTYKIYSYFLLLLTIASLIGDSRDMAGFFFGLYAGWILFLELDAWHFAFKNRDDWRKYLRRVNAHGIDE